MSARDTIRLVLTRHYRRDNDPQGSAVRLLAQYDADRGGEAYDGELAMLRGLVRTLRVVVRPDEVDVAEVRRLLHEHASDDAAARKKSSPAGADATPAALLAHASEFEIPRPGNSLPLLLQRSYGHADRWSILDRDGHCWHRDGYWVAHFGGISDDTKRDSARFTLAEAWPLAHRIAAGAEGGAADA
jgi:hypothetical protein